jgi:hypothetical protein
MNIDHITAEVEYLGVQFADQSGGRKWKHYAYEVTLHNQRLDTSMTTPYMTGTGWKERPTVADVLPDLLSEARTYDDAGSFEQWATELSYDTDSRSAEESYRQAGGQADVLRLFLGEDYDRLKAEEWD